MYKECFVAEQDSERKETSIIEEDEIPAAMDGGEESEVSRLFYHALAETTGGMDQDEAAAYLEELFEGGAFETEQLFEKITTEKSPDLIVTSYHPDRAVREASLARKEQWKPTDAGELSYLASNELEVYLGTQGNPLEIGEAFTKIRSLSESTVLTARIVLGLWNSRRHNKQVSKEGSVAILLDEILQWQGIQKHSRTAHPGTTKRYTDGYRAEQKRRVIQDLAMLASCHVRGTCTITIRGKSTPIEVDGPYIRYDTVSRKTTEGEKVILGFLVAPGGWIGTYEQHQNESLAQIDRQIFTLNPQNDRYALRLALYLTERWREQAKEGNFSDPITMSDLLALSMIEAEKRHLASEIAPRVEAALARLETMGIIGKHLCLTPVDKERARWGKEWLASQWEILPPVELIRTYQAFQKKKRKRKPRITGDMS
jgi:hypothetical protein